MIVYFKRAFKGDGYGPPVRRITDISNRRTGSGGLLAYALETRRVMHPIERGVQLEVAKPFTETLGTCFGRDVVFILVKVGSEIGRARTCLDRKFWF